MTPEAGTESWYDRPVRENRALMTPPYPYPIDGKTVLMATVSQLVRRAGKPIAVVTGDLPLSDLSAYVQGLRPFGDGSVALIGGDDLWIANDDPALLGQPVADPLLKFLLSDLARAPVVRHIADGHLLMATRMTLPGLDESWVLLLRVPVPTLLASLTQMRDLMLQVAAVAMLLILAAVYFGGRLLTGPISEMTQRMEQLAQDQTDIAISGLARKDEIGQMARAVEVFRRHAIARLERAEAERRESAVRLERQERLEALVGGFRGSVASVLDQAARATSDLEAVSDELRAAAESSQTHALTARGTSERASGNLHAVASAATQLTASISSISQQVALTSAIVGTASADATAADAKVTGLASAASRISEVIGLIDAIARQTNLLALNATIEAARAGASGRGFSVVAAEVKALALQTTQATQNIAAQIATIQSETQEAVEAIRAIVTIMGEVETYAGAIAEAIQSQNVATSDIGSNLESAAVGTQRVVEDIERLNAAVVGTTHSARRVRDASRSVHEVTERLDGEIDDFLREVAAA